MAIVDNTNVKGAASAQVQNPALSAPGTLKVDSNPSFASSSDNPFGNMAVHIGAGNMAFSPIPRMGAEEYEKLAKTFREIAKEVENKNNAIEVKVLYLDRSFAPALHYEGFVVATTSRAKPDIGVGFNAILLEATGDPLKSMRQTFDNESVEIPQYADAVVDARLLQYVRDLLITTFGNKVPLHPSDTQVVPAGFDPEDSNAARKLLSNAAAAATTSLVMFADGGRHFRDVNLPKDIAEMKTKSGSGDADLTFIRSFTPSQEVNYLNQVVRASVDVKGMVGYRKNQGHYSYNDGSGPRVAAEVLGFMELMPVLPRHAFVNAQFNPALGYQQPPARFRPVFVITRPSANFSLTPGAVLFSILMAADLNRYSAWAAAFMPKKGSTGKNEIDLTDIGAISIDIPNPMNPNEPIARPPTKSHDFTTEALMQFLGSNCSPEMVVALDVPLAGPTTWYTSIFSAAAAGQPAAIEFLNNTMDELVGGGGTFKRMLPPGTPILASQVLNLETGYWEDGKNRRDIAEVDFVAVCNYADETRNPAMVERWTNSFLQFQRPEALRLRDRREIIQEVTGNQAVFTGRSVRLFLNGVWLKTALDALAAAKVTTMSEGGTFATLGGQRADASFLNNMALPAAAGWATGVGPVASGGSSYGTMATTPWGY